MQDLLTALAELIFFGFAIIFLLDARDRPQ